MWAKRYHWGYFDICIYQPKSGMLLYLWMYVMKYFVWCLYSEIYLPFRCGYMLLFSQIIRDGITIIVSLSSDVSDLVVSIDSKITVRTTFSFKWNNKQNIHLRYTTIVTWCTTIKINDNLHQKYCERMIINSYFNLFCYSRQATSVHNKV